MADIDIVPKHRSNMWLWIVIALVIVAALWFALGNRGRSARVGLLETPPPAVVMGIEAAASA